uniref:AGC-kinase C-terminal domain-containing protein n=1 Tax=Chrysotila carterae TaxID=13221 RepID=A0A7S4B5K6_CHRCT
MIPYLAQHFYSLLHMPVSSVPLLLLRAGSLKNGAEDIKKHKWYRGLNWAALYNKQMEAFITCNVKSQDDTSLFDKYTDSVEESGPLINPAKDKELFSTFDEDF